jgi:hypothetical protein
MLSLLSNQGRIDIATIVATVPLPVDGGGPPFPPSAPSIRFGVRVQWAAHRYEIRPRPDRVRRHVRARSMERPVDGAKGGAPGNRAPVVVCGIDVARAARALARLAVDAGVAESTDVRVGSGDLEQQLLTTARDEQATVLVVGSRVGSWLGLGRSLPALGVLWPLRGPVGAGPRWPSSLRQTTLFR